MRAYQSNLRFILILAAALLGPAAVAVAQKKPVLPEDYLALKVAGSAKLSPDSRWVVYTLRTWAPDPLEKDAKNEDEAEKKPEEEAAKKKYKPSTHLWLASSDPGAGIEPRQLTFGDKDATAPQWSPDGRFIGFITSRTHGEAKDPKVQIWLLPMAGGESYPLTAAKENVGSYRWSHDGRRIAFVSADPLPKEKKSSQEAGDDAEEYEKEVRYSHLWVIEVATKQAKQITSGKDFSVAGAPDWSPDDKSIAHHRQIPQPAP